MKNFVKYIKIVAAAACCSLVLLGNSVSVFAQGNGSVTSDGTNMRGTPSTSGDKVTSLTKDANVTVFSKIKGDDGKYWYKIAFEGSEGYVREDLLYGVNGDIPTEGEESPAVENTAADTTGTNAAQASASSNKGSVKSDVSVRSGASTATEKIANAAGGTELTILGQQQDSDGQIWYQVSYQEGDNTVEGFIRNDYVEVYPAETLPEETAETAEVENAAVYNDFEVKYEANSEGNEEWFLYDHQKGTKQAISNIYAVMDKSQRNDDEALKKIKTLVILVFVFCVLFVLALIVCLILAFKLKDNREYNYGYDDDEYYPEEDDNYDDGYNGNQEEYYEEGTDYEESFEDNYVPNNNRRKNRREKHSIDNRTSSKSWNTSTNLDDDDMELQFLDLE